MLETDIHAAFEYAYPLFAVAKTRDQCLRDNGAHAPQAPNTVRHERELSDHLSRWITSPNNDTLYSNAWLDLSCGPVRVIVDRQPADRYWSLAFMDAFSNHFSVVGQRLDGIGPVDLTLVGPGQSAPAGADRVICAPGMDVWLLCRWLVEGPHDLEKCHAMQDRMRIEPMGMRALNQAPPVDVSHDPGHFLEVVNHALGRNPPPPRDTDRLHAWASLGIRPGEREIWSRLEPTVQEAWQSLIGPAHDKVRASAAKGRRLMQGWVASAPEMGNFGDNFALRASVAMGGLAALEPLEAMYFVRFSDDDGQPLDGRYRYLLRVAASDIPTDSFWSFTMYEPTADGRRFFVDNQIGRYSIGNRTLGLQRQIDGSLDIVVQRELPTDAQARANWLPCAPGTFQVALRTYLPRAELREGRSEMPRLLRQS